MNFLTGTMQSAIKFCESNLKLKEIADLLCYDVIDVSYGPSNLTSSSLSMIHPSIRLLK